MVCSRCVVVERGHHTVMHPPFPAGRPLSRIHPHMYSHAHVDQQVPFLPHSRNTHIQSLKHPPHTHIQSNT